MNARPTNTRFTAGDTGLLNFSQACAEPLREDAFESHLAGVDKDGRPVAFHVFVEPYAAAGLGQDHLKRGLAALMRITPQVVAVQFDQVEGVQERALIMAAVANEIERGNAIVIAGDSLA